MDPGNTALTATATGVDLQTLVEELVSASLDAYRQGTLGALARGRARAARWLMRRWLPIAVTAVADEAALREDAGRAASILLRFLVTQLRPDAAPDLDVADEAAWLHQPAWRPMLAVMCHARMQPVRAFPARYRARAGESALDHLCGLWGVDTSTFYRYLERGKRRLAAMALQTSPTIAQRLALRRFVSTEWFQAQQPGASASLSQWHAQQSKNLRAAGQAVSALWHAVQSGEPPLAIEILRGHATALAGEPETDALLERLAASNLPLDARFEFWLSRGVIARIRGATEREQRAYERALQYAVESGLPLLLGRAYGALARFYESRDANRAFACYEDSATYLLSADPQHLDPTVLEHFMTTQVRLSWMYVLRNHPRAREFLDKVDALSRSRPVPDDLAGMIEQTWGEYWRIAGDLERAIEAKHRALNIFERIGDQRSVLVTYQNLILLHGLSKDLDRAREHADRILQTAKRALVEPEVLVGTHGNLALACVWSKCYDLAIAEYARALEISVSANLRLHANRTRLNLATAYYWKFLDSHDPQDERRGDGELERFFAAPESELTPSMLETARGIKAEVLGVQTMRVNDRLLDEESAAHLTEMTEIGRQRAMLAKDADPESTARRLLAISSAYLAISMKEREVALQLIERHQLGDRLASELGQLRDTFDRNLSSEERLMARYKQQASDLLDDGRRAALVAHLFREGAINKSGYAEVCAVSPATASKHLATLADRGLLHQTGKGPSTRYQLPE